MNNYQWLLEMDGEERQAWFDAEHVTQSDTARQSNISEKQSDAFTDSQSKLDVDLRGLMLLLVDDVVKTAHNQTFDKHLVVDTWWNAFVYITDRQAAITENEIGDVLLNQDERIAELQAQLDEAMRTVDDYKERKDALRFERDELQAQVNELQNAITDICRKHPYTFDPEALQDNLATIGKYIDELQAQADEKWNMYVAEHERAEKLQAELDDLNWEAKSWLRPVCEDALR